MLVYFRVYDLLVDTRRWVKTIGRFYFNDFWYNEAFTASYSNGLK